MLQTVGFSKTEGLEAENKLRDDLVYGPAVKKKKTAKITENRTAVEIICETAPKTGIIYRGEYGSQSNFISDTFFPFHISDKISLYEPIIISKRMDSNAYTAMAYDYKHKIPIIFYLQNEVDMYLYYHPNEKEQNCEVYLSGLADTGKILLPVENDKVDVVKYDNDEDDLDLLLPDEEPDEPENEVERQLRMLTEREMLEFINMTSRAKDEDIYSIVETTFMPCGTEVDTYTVICKILSVDSIINYITQEEMYILGVECNSIIMEICINKNKLMGEPEVGRRFKGNIWLQGFVNWKAENKDE